MKSFLYAFTPVILIATVLNSSAQAETTPSNLKTARAAYSQSQTVLAQTQDKLTQANITLSSAQQTHTLNTTVLNATQSAASTAYSIAITQQGKTDALARQMYMTGSGASPTDLFLTTDPATFPLALDTHNYLLSLANSQIISNENAQKQANSTQAAFEQAQTNYIHSEKALTQTKENVQTLTQQVQNSREGVNQAAATYLNYAVTYTPPPEPVQTTPTICNNWFVTLLYNTGFRGENIREAWAIGMRESGANEKSISHSGDYGIFQLNFKTWNGQSWWDTNLILTREYNVKIAYDLSRGGATWYPWGLDGNGRVNAQAYKNSGWSDARILDDIVEPYMEWYGKFPCQSTNIIPPTPIPTMSTTPTLPATPDSTMPVVPVS